MIKPLTYISKNKFKYNICNTPASKIKILHNYFFVCIFDPTVRPDNYWIHWIMDITETVPKLKCQSIGIHALAHTQPLLYIQIQQQKYWPTYSTPSDLLKLIFWCLLFALLPSKFQYPGLVFFLVLMNSDPILLLSCLFSPLPSKLTPGAIDWHFLSYGSFEFLEIVLPLHFYLDRKLKYRLVRTRQCSESILIV